jgi:hypothetical protein
MNIISEKGKKMRVLDEIETILSLSEEEFSKVIARAE